MVPDKVNIAIYKDSRIPFLLSETFCSWAFSTFEKVQEVEVWSTEKSRIKATILNSPRLVYVVSHKLVQWSDK